MNEIINYIDTIAAYFTFGWALLVGIPLMIALVGSAILIVIRAVYKYLMES